MSDEVRALFDRYVRALDDGAFADWLDLFADDGYYGVIHHRDYAKDNNLMIVGEAKAKLAERVRTAAEEDKRRRTHLLSAIEAREEVSGRPWGRANFAVLCDGALAFSGRYFLDLGRGADGLIIARCTVVLDNDVLNDVILMPL